MTSLFFRRRLMAMEELHLVLKPHESIEYYNNFKKMYNGRRAKTVVFDEEIVNSFVIGKWLTICLPFEVSWSQIQDNNWVNRLYNFKYVKYTDGDDAHYTFYYSQVHESLKAGVGYIINFNNTANRNPVFKNVIIDTSKDKISNLDTAGFDALDGVGTEKEELVDDLVFAQLVGTLRFGHVDNTSDDFNYYTINNNRLLQLNNDDVNAYSAIIRIEKEEIL